MLIGVRAYPMLEKALEYAFTRMNKPSKWKFSKAKQNWIIRNVWSVEAVSCEFIDVKISLRYSSFPSYISH